MIRHWVANSQALGSARSARRAVGWTLRLALVVCGVLAGLSASVPKLSAQSAAKPRILISVMDSDRHPLAGVTIEGRSGSTLLCKALTDVHGLATLSDCGSATGVFLSSHLGFSVPSNSSLSSHL